MAKVMIVDDNKDIVETLKIIMEKEGHKTETASNGKELLDKVEKASPNLVLLDVMMPGLTTKEIMQKLKDMGLGKLKVILVTVVRFSDEEKKLLLKDYNIVDYITKPFDVQNLVKSVKKNLK